MSTRSLILACALTTAAAWRIPGLSRLKQPDEMDVIEASSPNGAPRELQIETGAPRGLTEVFAHETAMDAPFVDTHKCLLASLEDYLETIPEGEATKRKEAFENTIMLKVGGHRVSSNAADYFKSMKEDLMSKTLIHLMEKPPGRNSHHIERIIRSQKLPALNLPDLLIIATDTESLHPDIDTDVILSTDFKEIHPWLVVWHGDEEPVLQYLHNHNYICYKDGNEHWCVGGQRAIEAGMKEFCGCSDIYDGCQAFPVDLALALTHENMDHDGDDHEE